MNHPFTGLIKWSAFKFFNWLLILSILVIYQYANLLLHDETSQMVQELTDSKAKRDQIIALISDEAEQQHQKNKVALYISHRAKKEALDHYKQIESQTKGFKLVGTLVADKMGWASELKLAKKTYQAASAQHKRAQDAYKASGEAIASDSLNRRLRVASPEKRLAYETIKQQRDRAFDYTKKCLQEYEYRVAHKYDANTAKYDRAMADYKTKDKKLSKISQTIGREKLKETRAQLSKINHKIHNLSDKIQGPSYEPRPIILSQMPQATWILLFVIITPVGIKIFLYYFVAPWLSRFPAIQVPTDENAPSPSEITPSNTSVEITLPLNHVALIKPSYLQRGNQNAKRSTQWFLNRSIPFSSLASGMYFLTKIRSHSEHEVNLEVSVKKFPLDEVGIIQIPKGASMVIKPHNLVGVITEQNHPVQITRHWRLFSLHAWLTLQLRYLVFHGECQLILRGCRGFKTKEPDSNNPQMINQSATMGFCTGLSYKNTRCETFMSYLSGEENLFNDMFLGDEGIFIYEQVPSQSLKGGITGRGIEGLIDTVLKVAGI